MNTRVTGATRANCLSTWVQLNENIMDLSEKDCWRLLETERKGDRRIQVMLRLYGRANKLRSERERAALLSEKTPVAN